MMDTLAAQAGAQTPERMLLLGPEDLLGRAREPLVPGVEHEVLWRRGIDRAGLMWVEGGAGVPEHEHAEAEHHIWLLEGRARVGGRTFTHPAYWHVPAGVVHRIEGIAPDGCTVLYLYLGSPERGEVVAPDREPTA
jgi:hypothetical protein